MVLLLRIFSINVTNSGTSDEGIEYSHFFVNYIYILFVSSIGGWDHRLADRKPPDQRLPTRVGEPEALLAWPTGQQALQALLPQ